MSGWGGDARGCPTCAELRAELADARELAATRKRRITTLERQLAEARGEAGMADDLAPLIHEAAAYWREKCNHPKAKLDAKRYRAVRARLVAADTPQEGLERIKRGVDGAAAGANVSDRTGERYDDLELICRSESHLDSFIKRVPKGDAGDLERKLIGA